MLHLSDEPFACPTFNSYSTDQLAEIGKNVADEFNRENHHDDEGFEFAKLLENMDDEIDGPPVLPVFHQVNDDELPLKNLCIEERETVSSSSDSDEEIPPESFCIWMPKFGNSSSASAPASCRKSKSTGSALSRRFRIQDLLRRSNSEGKDSFVFLTPKNNCNNNKNVKVVAKQQSGEAGKATGESKKAAAATATAHERFYVANRSVKEGEKRKSYLPYRKHIVGFFR